METQRQNPSATREKILQAAMRLFFTRGIKSTGVDTIIAESGVAKMTFYKYFPSKQKLVLEVLKQGEDLWFKKFREAVESQFTDPRQRLLAVFDLLETWFKDPQFRGCPHINAVSESADPHAEECVYSQAYKKRIAASLENTAKEAGLRDPRQLAEKLLLLIDGAIVRSQMEGSARPAAVAKEIAELLIKDRS